MTDDLSWRRQSIYSSNDDYVFASETMRGKQPYWPDNLMKRHIRPVAKANGRITLDVYTQAVNSNKRGAQSKVVKMMVSSEGAKAAIVGTTDSKKHARNAG